MSTLGETTSHRYSSEASGSEGCFSVPALAFEGIFQPRFSTSANFERRGDWNAKAQVIASFTRMRARDVERQGVQHERNVATGIRTRPRL